MLSLSSTYTPSGKGDLGLHGLNQWTSLLSHLLRQDRGTEGSKAETKLFPNKIPGITDKYTVIGFIEEKPYKRNRIKIDREINQIVSEISIGNFNLFPRIRNSL